MRTIDRITTATILFLFSTPLLANGGTSSDAVNAFFGFIVKYMAMLLFWKPFSFFPLPAILLVMAGGGLFFTFRFWFVNFRLFRHAIDVVRGKFDNPDDEGEISHFQALTSALSATVGLGNIAGVAVAIGAGGPGAVFWLWIVAFFGMSMKFSSCTLAQLYREVDDKGKVMGGPMVYLEKGFKELLPSLAPLGKVFSVIFCIFCISGSFGGGNLFQSNQTFELLANEFTFMQGMEWPVGIILAFFVGLVIIGGIKRIGEVTSKMIPAMVVFYCGTCLVIIFSNLSMVPDMFRDIFTMAMKPGALWGGFIGVLIQGIKRASFSNEAGLGSAAIAHAAAKTDEPVREGVVAMIGPFIDTHVVCTMSALAILITGAHLDPALQGKGAAITAKAFASVGPAFPTFLTIGAVIFAFSTVVSWSYYGEQATSYLFGPKMVRPFRVLYVLVVVLGPSLSLSAVIDFSDLMLLSMAFPNILGMIFLSGKVKEKLVDYTTRLKNGEMKEYKA